MTVKKCISLPETVYNFAKEKTQKYFGSNLSGYINFLIANDREKDQKNNLKEMAKNLTFKYFDEDDMNV